MPHLRRKSINSGNLLPSCTPMAKKAPLLKTKLRMYCRRSVVGFLSCFTTAGAVFLQYARNKARVTYGPKSIGDSDRSTFSERGTGTPFSFMLGAASME